MMMALTLSGQFEVVQPGTTLQNSYLTVSKVMYGVVVEVSDVMGV